MKARQVSIEIILTSDWTIEGIKKAACLLADDLREKPSTLGYHSTSTSIIITEYTEQQ